MIERLSKENDVLFLSYSDDGRFQKPEYFQDASHLKDVGSNELINIY